jgi:ComF family protein
MSARSLSRIKEIKSAVLGFIYPPYCVECRIPLKDGEGALCYGCGTLLCLIDPSECCASCFGRGGNIDHLCVKCHWNPNPWIAMAAACELTGPGKTILHQYKYAGKSYWSDALGGLMLKQLVELEWPDMDMIVPVPLAFSHLLKRGYNQVELLAEYLGNGLEIPVVKPLKRPSGEYSQAGLNRAERLRLTGDDWEIDQRCHLEGKRVLLIDDVYTTGSTLRAAAGALHRMNPLEIYVLATFRA